MKNVMLMTVVTFVCSLLPSFASGSAGGGYGGGGRAVKQEVYQLGQSIFTGKAELADEVISTSVQKRQSNTLTRLQKRIARKSKDDAKKIDVAGLAGRLTSKQFRALTYYLDVRFVNPSKYAR